MSCPVAAPRVQTSQICSTGFLIEIWSADISALSLVRLTYRAEGRFIIRAEAGVWYKADLTGKWPDALQRKMHPAGIGCPVDSPHMSSGKLNEDIQYLRHRAACPESSPFSCLPVCCLHRHSSGMAPPEIHGYVTPAANVPYEFWIFNGIREMHSMSIFLSGPGAGGPHIWLGEKERERT